MNALTRLKTDLDSTIGVLSEELQKQIKNYIDSIVELEINRVKNTQILEVKAYHLRAGDIVFDCHRKGLHRVSHAAKRSECQFNVPEDRKTEILVMYGEDEPTDYFNPNDDLYILVDIGDIVNIKLRTLEEMEDD